MTEAICILVGLVIGGAAGWYAGVLRGRRDGQEQISQKLGDVAAAQAALEEVRRQAGQKDEELAAVRKSLGADLEGVREALEAQKVDSAKANERLESAREHFAEQRRQIEQMEKKVKESFEALSAAALKSNNEQFVMLAEAKMKPLREQLERYEKQIAGLEKARQEAYGGLNEKLESLEERERQLGKETGQLVAALRHSGAKGKWGEATLQRIVELSEMTEHCDFETQQTLDSGQRPDLVVQMPGGRTLVVDSKVNTGAYLDAAETTDESRRKQFLDKYVSDVRGTVRALAGKEYWKQFTSAPEFVVMFMPGEAFFAAAVSHDPDLLINGMDQRVLLASPTTLMALLLAVRHGWQQQQVAENARKIAEAGRELYDRLCTFVSHLDAVRVGIEKAGKAYDDAVGSWERRTLPSARKLKELGAADAGKELPLLRETEIRMRSLPAEEEAGGETDVT